jgi:RNA polymerase sigma-70 factor (ECF subfamily)
VAFRLLVERHQPMVRARARWLCGNPSDVDDVVQESFLRAFIALDRLQDPERFAGWLAGAVFNVCRNLSRRRHLTLIPDWPEPLHPAAAEGLPSAEDLDLAEALRDAVAGLPAGQQRAVALHYYADLPPAQIAESPGAARASLHKARLRLGAYLTQHRPDLVPAASRRTHMTAVRITSVERRVPPGPLPDTVPTDVVVLADDTGRRQLPIWLLARDGDRLSPAAASEHPASLAARTADELVARMLRAVGARVTGVDIDDLGPGVTAARIEIASPAGTRHVTARLGDGLAMAATAHAPIRLSDTVMGRLTVSEASSVPGALPAPTAGVLHLGDRPRYEPLNMRFADGLNRWLLGGSFAEHASESRWHDYTCAAGHEVATLSAAVPRPEGFAFLAQEMFADDYIDAVITFRGQIRVSRADDEKAAGRAGLFLRTERGHDTRPGRNTRGSLTEAAVLADPSNHIVMVTAGGDWTRHEVTARVPGDCTTVMFGVFLTGPGRVELRDAELARAI